jgi:hypothetical protein
MIDVGGCAWCEEIVFRVLRQAASKAACVIAVAWLCSVGSDAYGDSWLFGAGARCPCLCQPARLQHAPRAPVRHRLEHYDLHMVRRSILTRLLEEVRKAIVLSILKRVACRECIMLDMCEIMLRSSKGDCVFQLETCCLSRMHHA